MSILFVSMMHGQANIKFWEIYLNILNSSWRLSCSSLWKYWLRKQMHSSRLLSMKMGPIVWSETSVRNYLYSLRNKLEERSSQLLRVGSLKSRILIELWSLVRVLSLLLLHRLCGPKVNSMWPWALIVVDTSDGCDVSWKFCFSICLYDHTSLIQ